MQQLPDDFTQQDIALYGQAILTDGLVVSDAIAGIGLLTRGLAWPAPQIWLDTTLNSGIATSWTPSASAASTSWTESAGAGSSTVTIWTNEPKGSIWGEV